MTNKEIYEYYKKQLDLKKNNVSNETKKTYFFYLDKFIECLDISLLDIRRKHIIKVLDDLNLDVSANNMLLSSIWSMYNILMNSYEFVDIIEFNPVVGISRAKSNPKEKVPLDYKSINELLSVAKNSRDYAILTILSQTGMRVGDLINITIEQYNERDEFNGILILNGKGGKDRVCYLNEKCITAIELYLLDRKDSEFNNLFISNSKKPMCKRSLSKTWKTLGRKIGMTESKVENLCNHLFRTSLATKKIEDGVELEVVKEILGHESISTTMIYAKVSKNRIKEAMLEVV